MSLYVNVSSCVLEVNLKHLFGQVLPAANVRRIASAACVAGVTDQTFQKLGRRKTADNGAKVVDKLAWEAHGVVEPYLVDVPAKNDVGEKETRKLPLILPHEYIFAMHKDRPEIFRE